MQHPFAPIYTFFKPNQAGQPVPRSEDVDIDPSKKNIFQNNVLYFQKYKDLQVKVEYLQKLNTFLVAQALQGFSSKKIPAPAAKPGRKKSMKFEDDRCLNKTYQLFNIFKSLLENSDHELCEISSTYFPSNFDFESALYNKHHQTIINLVLKSSINSIICLKKKLAAAPQAKTASASLLPQRRLQLAQPDNTSLFLAHADLEQLSQGSQKGSLSLAKPNATAIKQLHAFSVSDGLSFSHHKPDGPDFSDSFFNTTEIKNLLQYRPTPAVAKEDKAVQVGPEDRSRSSNASDSKDNFVFV